MKKSDKLEVNSWELLERLTVHPSYLLHKYTASAISCVVRLVWPSTGSRGVVVDISQQIQSHFSFKDAQNTYILIGDLKHPHEIITKP